MIATLSASSIYFKDRGPILKIAAGTKENDERGETKRTSFLKLVPGTVKRPPNRTFRIGISDDMFGQDNPVREYSVETLPRSDTDPLVGNLKTGKTSLRKSDRFETIFACAAAGLLLGYFFGRYSRK